MKNFNEIILDWEIFLKSTKNFSVNTCLAYLSDIREFVSFLKKYLGEEVTTERFLKIEQFEYRAWFSSQKNNKLHSLTISRRFSALKNFFNFLKRSGYIDFHKIFLSSPPKSIKKLPRPISFENIKNLISSINLLSGEKWVLLRDEALIILIYSVGLRINEALNLTIEKYISAKESEFLEIFGKGKKVRSVPLIEPVIVAIDKYIESSPYIINSYLFIGAKGKKLLAQVFEKRILKLRKLLNFSDELTPHSLRHSCASHLVASSNDLRGVQELLGHESLSTTQIYTEIDDALLTEIYQKTHPRSNKK